MASDYCMNHTRLGPFLRSAVKRKRPGTSLVVQWLKICLPVGEKWVRSLVQGDSTCQWRAVGATKLGTSIPEAVAAWNPRSATREATAMRSPSIRARESQRGGKESIF